MIPIKINPPKSPVTVFSILFNPHLSLVFKCLLFSLVLLGLLYINLDIGTVLYMKLEYGNIIQLQKEIDSLVKKLRAT